MLQEPFILFSVISKFEVISVPQLLLRNSFGKKKRVNFFKDSDLSDSKFISKYVITPTEIIMPKMIFKRVNLASKT